MHAIHGSFQVEMDVLDEQLTGVYHDGNAEEMARMATMFSVGSGDRLHIEWMALYGELFARFREEDPTDPICNCKMGRKGFLTLGRNALLRRLVHSTNARMMIDSEPDLASKQQLRGSGDGEDFIPLLLVSRDKSQLKSVHRVRLSQDPTASVLSYGIVLNSAPTTLSKSRLNLCPYIFMNINESRRMS